MMTSRALSTASFVALLCLAACGQSHPIPGDAGPRPDTGPARSSPDAVRFCEESGRIECLRQRQRGEIDEVELSACIADIPARCAGSAWPASCRPTSAETDDCIAALRSLANLDIPIGAIPECNFCP